MASYLNKYLTNKQLILASASPRRAELLRSVGIEIQVRPSTFEEDLCKSGISPPDYAMSTALQKGREVYRSLGSTPDSIVLAADTVVDLDNEIMEKPADAADARRMLSKLSGRSHCVHTGVAIVYSGGEKTFAASTKVTFVDLRTESLDSYVESGEPFDKAGGYGIQHMWMVDSIEGCYFNVVGLPVSRVLSLIHI